jgi:hypothetical protein
MPVTKSIINCQSVQYLLFGLLYLATPVCFAWQEDFFVDIELDASADAEIDKNLDAKSHNLSFDGWFKQVISYGIDDPNEAFSRNQSGLNKIESSFQLQTDWKISDGLTSRAELRLVHDAIYQFKNEYSVSIEERQRYEDRVEVKDLFFDFSLSENLYLRMGNQIVAWGQAESITVTDVVSRKDLRTYGQNDLEDTRLQVPAFKLSYYLDKMLIESVVTYRADSDELAPSMNEFDAYISLRHPDINITKNQEKHPFEFFFRVKRNFSGGDWSFVLADANANDLSVERIITSGSQRVLEFGQKRFQMIGGSTSWVDGFWIWKAELAMHFKRSLAPNTENYFSTTDGWERCQQLRSMFGLEYVGWGDASIFFEVDSIQTKGNVNSLSVDKSQVGFSSRIFWQDLNTGWTLQADWSRLVGNNGDILRFSGDYKLNDSNSIGALLVAYESSDSNMFLENYKNNDAIQFHWRYGF